MNKGRNKRITLQTLELQKSFIQDVWKEYQEKQGGRAEPEALHFYQFLTNDIKKSITEFQKELNAFNPRGY